ncbi:hypothetical protein D047_2715B, partial [Vibrio parahaemolyticus VPTS-2010_2]
IESVITRLRIL